MKTKIVLLLGILCISYSLQAQTYYYNQTKTFKMNGYTYQCDVPSWKMVSLYNKENKYAHEMIYQKKDGTKVPERELEGKRLFENDNWSRQKSFSIVKNAFSATEKKRLKNAKMTVTMTMDPASGKIIEVDFRFLNSSSFATIPVSTYRKIELNLKSQIWFTATEIGKELKFIKISWRQEIE